MGRMSWLGLQPILAEDQSMNIVFINISVKKKIPCYFKVRSLWESKEMSGAAASRRRASRDPGLQSGDNVVDASLVPLLESPRSTKLTN